LRQSKFSLNPFKYCRMKWTTIIILAILFSSCKKNSDAKLYTVQGKILESTSNPIPVTNYQLYVYQKSNSGLLGGVSGIDKNIKTDNNGFFMFQYDPNKNFGFSQGGTNPNDISIYGIDTIKYKDIGALWYPIQSSLDINLNTIYLFKKIQSLVIKVQFNTGLNAGESLEVIASDSSGSSHKTLTGPISSGTLLIVDIIHNCKLSIFDLSARQYRLNAALQKPSYLKDSTIILNQDDEILREIILTY
jgi:hypothetical protein